MSLLLGTAALLVVLVFGNFLAALGRANLERTRAQTAADAAALAAIAESSLAGSGAHESAAARFAELNGAELVSCDCPSGAIAVQVEVARDGVTARARAALDPSRMAPLVGTAGSGLDPRLARALDQLLDATQGRVRLVSGYRSTQRQTMLWNRALARYGSAELADDWVAPPGRSMHEAGLAVDLGGDLDLASRAIAELGLPLYRPLPHEPWHFELVGTR